MIHHHYYLDGLILDIKSKIKYIKVKINYNIMSINYTLYSHMANDLNWNIESYEVIKHITTLNELVSIIEYIPDELLTNCMFFFMKDNIKK